MKNGDRKISLNTLKWLWIFTGLICLVVFHSYILGNETVAFYDAGSDTKDQYLMWYNGIVNSLRNGTFSPWDFRNGFGMNTMGHHLTDPFLVPVYILGVIFGPEHLASYLVYTQVAKIFLAATACYLYLTEFSHGEKSKLLVSLMYAFNGYLIVWGQHYALGTAVVLFPLILTFIEQTIRNRRFHIGLCLVTVLSIFSSFYQGYMCMLAGGIYTCMRVLMLEGESVKKRLQSLLTTAGCMILGVLMGAVRLFPSAAAQIGSSGRLESEETLFQRIFGEPLFWQSDVFKTVVYRLFSSNLQGNGEDIYLGKRNYYEDATLFFSTLFIILALQYMVTIHKQKCSRKNKILQYGSVLLALAVMFCPSASVPFNGFYGPFFRHTFILMPLFAVVSAMALDRILKERRIHVPALVVSVLLMTAVYQKGYRLFNEPEYKTHALYLWLTGAGLAFALYAFCKKKLEDVLCYALLIAMLVGNIATDSYMCYSPRVTLSKDHPVYYSETYHSSVNEALAWLQENDNSFYRVEKDYFSASPCLDSLAQNYRGISAYNSNQNSGIKKMADILWPQLYCENDRNHIQFSNGVWDSVMASLSGVKYVLSKSDTFNVVGYELYHQVGDVYIYRNTLSDSIGKFFTKTITEEAFEEQRSELNSRALLTDVLIVEKEDEFTIDNSEIKGYEKEAISDILAEGTIEKEYVYKADPTVVPEPLVYSFALNQESLSRYASVILQFRMKVTGRTEVKISFDGNYEHTLVVHPENDKFLLSVPTDASSLTMEVASPTEDITLSRIRFSGYEKKQQFSEGAEITINAAPKDDYLTGHISASEDGLAMLAIPVEDGWSIYLDGEEQQIITGDYGFITFPVKAGEHELTVEFEAPLLKEGIAVSIASVAVFLLVLYASRKKKKKTAVV